MDADPAATQAAALALAAVLPSGVQLRASPLLRCRRLADALQLVRPDLAASLDARLQEMDFGRWEMQPWSGIGPGAIDAWTADFAQHRPGGGESAQALLDRVAMALDEATGAAQDTVWITHAGVIRAVRLLLSGVREISSASQWPSQPLPFGGSWCHQVSVAVGPSPA